MKRFPFFIELRYVCLILGLTGLCGCPVNLDTLDYPEIEPKVQDIAGVYVPTAETHKDIRERGHYPERDISIQLSADGSFSCKNIPDWWMTGFGTPSGKFLDKSGSWKPIRHQSWWEVGLDFSAAQFSSPKTSILLVGKKPPFFLRIDLGDPDQGEAMSFVKQ